MAWLSRNQKTRPVSARTPDATRIYAVGDIHGRADLLSDLLARIRADVSRHPERKKVVIFLGDYIDRGPQSREVLEILSQLSIIGSGTHFLMGNHEQVMLAFLEDPLTNVDWLRFGGLATLESYGVIHNGNRDDALGETSEALRANIPARHFEFLRNLEYRVQLGDYLFVHAGIKPGVAIADQDAQDLLWIRDRFLDHERPHPATVVHGHHVTRTIDVQTNRIGVDTGAYATGCLTCLVLDDTERFVLDSKHEGPLPLPS